MSKHTPFKVRTPDTPSKRLYRRPASSSPSKRFVHRDGRASWSDGVSIALPEGKFIYMDNSRPSGSRHIQAPFDDPFLLEDTLGEINDMVEYEAHDKAKELRRELYRAKQNNQKDNWNKVLENGLMDEYCKYLKRSNYLAIDTPSSAEPCKCNTAGTPCEVKCVYTNCKLILCSRCCTVLIYIYTKPISSDCLSPVAASRWFSN